MVVSLISHLVTERWSPALARNEKDENLFSWVAPRESFARLRENNRVLEM